MADTSQAVPDENVRSGGHLLVAGFLCWVVNGLLLLSAFVISAISTGETLQTNPRATVIRALRDPVLVWLPTVPAAIALIAGAVLFAVGLLRMRRGTVSRTTEGDAREVFGASAATRRKARISAVLVPIYGVVGGIGFVGFALSVSGTAAADGSGDGF